MGAKFAGWTPDALKLALAGEPTGDVRMDALSAFVRSIVNQPGTLPAETVEAVRAAGFTDAQLVDIALVISTITFTNFFNRLNDTDLDFPATR